METMLEVLVGQGPLVTALVIALIYQSRSVDKLVRKLDEERQDRLLKLEKRADDCESDRNLMRGEMLQMKQSFYGGALQSDLQERMRKH